MLTGIMTSYCRVVTVMKSMGIVTRCDCIDVDENDWL